MKNYRTAFFVTLTASLILAAALGFVSWHSRRAAMNQPAGTRTEWSMDTPAGTTDQPASAQATSSEAKLVPIQLSPERLQSIGVKIGEVQLKPMHNEIRTVGSVEVDERRLAYVQVRFPGWIQKAFVDATYQYIRKGQPLFTIYSQELVATEQEYLIAKRNQTTLGQSTVPGVASGSVSLLNAAAERLKQWQVPVREIEQLEKSGEVRHELEVDSPVSGYVTERNALPNQYVQPETRLYTVADLSTVWVYAAVFQNEIGQLKVGDPATITTDAYPGRAFTGRVDFIYPQVDMTTRTARVRLVFSNPSLKLKPGMFVNVKMDISMGRQISIPVSGVFHSGTRSIVFVDHGSGYLEPREVELGPQAGNEYVVLKGLKAGERIVTSANFLIDSESQLQAAIGTFVPPPPGAGAAASMNAPVGEAEVQVEFSTEPSPPHKGSNIFRVKLTGSGGAPITGAQVTAQNFMPAMPEMGMAAMSDTTPLAEKGNGIYEAKVSLESGGTWRITVIVMKDGKSIATKHLSINAEGGI
jgi:Cu(I)/Ag(I) efflux system membrane fusion protein/cobalt-zinc-cadmium efflux system membrane fusion protein